MRLIGLFSCCIVITFLAFAENETRSNSYQWITGERDSIPSWVINNQGNGRYVGVSDPCLDSITGCNQALSRAWLLALLDNGVKVQLLHENFQEIKTDFVYDISGAKVNQIMRFSPMEKVGHYRVGHSHINKFGESLIEIVEVSSAEDADYTFKYTQGVDSIRGEYIMLAEEKSLVVGTIYSSIYINCRINGEQINAAYIEKGTRETKETISIIENDTIPIKNANRYWYEDRKIAEIETFSFPLNKGLWNAIFNSLIYAMVNDSNYAYTIKQVNQSYNTKMLTMTRSVYSDDLIVTFNLAQIFNNNLEPVWRIREIKNKK